MAYDLLTSSKRPMLKREYLYIQKRFPINKDKHRYILEFRYFENLASLI